MSTDAVISQFFENKNFCFSVTVHFLKRFGSLSQQCVLFGCADRNI